MTRFSNKLIQSTLLISGIFLLSACGNNTGDGIGAIDLSEYMPTDHMVKEYLVTKSDAPDKILLDTITLSSENGDTVVKTRRGGWLIKKSTVYDNNITTIDYAILGVETITDRYVDIGDTIFHPCHAEALIDTITKDGHTYNGDILKIKCESGNDIRYSYLMRDIGVIAEIDDDCMSADGIHVESSNMDACPADRQKHRYKFLNL